MSAYVCRVCLASNNRMICIYKSKLQDIYEKLSSSELRPGDRRPEMICYICYSQLQRCRTFSDMSQKSNRILSNLLYEGVVEVTPDTIAKLNLEPAYNLTATTIPFVSLNHIISTIDLPVKEELVKTEEVDEDVYTNNSFEEELMNLTNENNLTDNVNNTDVQFVCAVCGKKCTTENELMNHLQTLTERTLILDSNNSVNTTKLTQQHEIVPLESKLFICDTCDKAFNNKHTLIKHIGIHVRKYHNTCKNTLTKHRMSTQSGKKPSYGCDICNKVFTHSNTLKEHKRTHTGERPYVCDFCNKTFSVKNSIKTHLRIHICEKPYGCGICNKTFSSKAGLKYHKINLHNGIKPYNCKSCDKAFGFKRALTLHMRIHTGEKPYKCKFCDKRFSQTGSLLIHTKIHTGEKPFGCDKCDKAFIAKKYLTDHMRMHTGEKPYTCNTCGMSFKQRCGLRRHQMIHTGEKPFKCKVCAKAVTTKNSLVSHMYIHTGEKPYACNTCSKSFKARSNLLRHQMIHTGEKLLKPFRCDICYKRFAIKSHLLQHKKHLQHKTRINKNDSGVGWVLKTTHIK